MVGSLVLDYEWAMPIMLVGAYGALSVERVSPGSPRGAKESLWS